MNIENEYRKRLKQELDVLIVTVKELSTVGVTKENIPDIIQDCYNLISIIDYTKVILTGIEMESGEEFCDSFPLKRLILLEEKLSNSIAFNDDDKAVSILKSIIELTLSDEINDVLIECMSPSKAVA